jgi:hypothetical protein
MAALYPARRRLFSALLRQSRRSFASATDSSEKTLLSPDDWTAFQLDRAERTTLGQSILFSSSPYTTDVVLPHHQLTSFQNLAQPRHDITLGNLTIHYTVQRPHAT